MGLSAGPVPPRVDAHVKAGLLELVDQAVEVGWSARRASARPGVDDARLGRWLFRRATDELTDRAPGGAPVHGLLPAKRAAIVELFEAWAAHRPQPSQAGPSRLEAGVGARQRIHDAPGAD